MPTSCCLLWRPRPWPDLTGPHLAGPLRWRALISDQASVVSSACRAPGCSPGSSLLRTTRPSHRTSPRKACSWTRVRAAVPSRRAAHGKWAHGAACVHACCGEWAWLAHVSRVAWRPRLCVRRLCADDWSDDELEDLDVGDTLVVPISMVPTPQVLSNGSGPSGDSDGPGFRASAYNERMARARNATMAQRRTSSCEHPRPPPRRTHR